MKIEVQLVTATNNIYFKSILLYLTEIQMNETILAEFKF